MNKFFIIGNYQKAEHGVFAVMEDEETVALFPTREAARKFAEGMTHCKHFGYEIFERGTGSS